MIPVAAVAPVALTVAVSVTVWPNELVGPGDAVRVVVVALWAFNSVDATRKSAEVYSQERSRIGIKNLISSPAIGDEVRIMAPNYVPFVTLKRTTKGLGRSY